MSIIKAATEFISDIFLPRQEVCTSHKFVLSCVVGDELDGFDKLVVCDYCGQEAIQHSNGKLELINEEGDGDGE